MNNDLPIRFKKIEEIEARKSFDPDSIISTENFKDLLGYYKNFPKKVKCQVLKTNNPCNHGHQEGFLGLLSNGKEALIGIDCGDKYFEGEEFKKKKGYVISEISITDNLETLNQLLSDDEYEISIDNLRSRLRILKKDVTSVEEKLGSKLVTVLKNMSKTKNNSVMVQYNQTDEDENGKSIEKWFDYRVGAIQGSMIFDHLSSFSPIFGDLKKIKDTLPKITLTRDSGKIKLKKWVTILETRTNITMNIEELENQYQLFMQETNLMLLTLLVENLKEKIPAGQLALKKSGITSPTYSQSKKYVTKYIAQITTELNVKNIRISR